MVATKTYNQNGFTLIEILISMVLLSMIMLVASMSFSTFSTQWQKRLGNFDDVLKSAKRTSLLQKTLQSTANYLAKDVKTEDPYYYFFGENQEISFVSNNPIFSEGIPALIHISIVYNETNDTSSLIYQEAPMDKKILLYAEHPPNFLNKLVLLENKINIRFNYFGWRSRDERLAALDDDEGEIVPSWNVSYSGKEVGGLPIAINISWDDSEPIIIPLAQDRAHMLNISKHSDNDA